MSEEAPNVFHANIAGVTHPNPDGTSRQDLVRCCQVGDEVFLIRDGDNEHDASAVMVMHRVGQLGWMRSVALEEFAEFLDKGGRATARICELTGGTPDKPTRGVNLEISEWPLAPRQPVIAAELVDCPPSGAADRSDEAKINAELARVQTHLHQIGEELAVQEKQASQQWMKGVGLRATHAYLKAATVLRAIAQRLIGWRLGMFII